MAARCSGCDKPKDKSPATYRPRPWATRPMERIHVSVTNFKGVQLLVVVDIFTKFIWTHILGKNPTTRKVLLSLDTLFLEFGLPNFLVSPEDNLYTSKAFSDKMAAYDIKHTVQPKDHPANNKIAVLSGIFITSRLQHVKDAKDYPELQCAVTSALFQYRSKPNSITNKTPFELMEANVIRTPPSVVRLSEKMDIDEQQANGNVKGAVNPSIGYVRLEF